MIKRGVKLKGIYKYVYDYVTRYSSEIVGINYGGQLSSKLKKREFLIKEHTIVFNKDLIMFIHKDKEKVNEIIDRAINKLNELES